MTHKKIISLLLSAIMLSTLFPTGNILAAENQGERTVYLHAQGPNPTDTTNVSTVYTDETAEIYFAVDNPNKGKYDPNGATDDEKHKEPYYDMNGYTVKIYFDPDYFAFVDETNTKPIDYTVPQDMNVSDKDDMDDIEDEVINTQGYIEYDHGRKIGDKLDPSATKTYNSAYVTVFFGGSYLPQEVEKTDENGNVISQWYNLCKLPLTPLKPGSTDVFIEVDEGDAYAVELFAKDKNDNYPPTFTYSAVNGGYHHINIKDRTKPAAPVANPPSGKYTEAQNVTLIAEEGCTIWYSINGGAYEEYYEPIPVTATTEISCYAERNGKKSAVVPYKYEIIPKSPYLFYVENGEKKLIKTPEYSEYSKYTVYASDKNIFDNIEDDSEIYYTFSTTADPESIYDGASDDPDMAETGWVRLDKIMQSIEIDKNRTVRLVTSKWGELSNVSRYNLGIMPAMVTAEPDGKTEDGEWEVYSGNINVTLSTVTEGATIYFTWDNSDPITSTETRTEYTMPITLYKDTVIRAVAYYDGVYSDVSSFWYMFTEADNYGVDAFYPPGIYEGSVNVTLTPYNPEHTVEYKYSDEDDWQPYTGVLVIDKDTEIIARSVDKNGEAGGPYRFTYIIKPLPPVFSPTSTQFTNSNIVTISTPESYNEILNSTTEHYDLYYTLDGTDPITNENRIHADEESDQAVIDITEYTVISAVVQKDKKTYSTVVTHSYDIVTKKPVKPITTLLPGTYIREIGDDEGFETKFMPVPNGTEIYYTISNNGKFVEDPVPNTEGTIKYDGTPIEITGETIIKAVAVNVFGVQSDIGIFSYVVIPEAPKAAPSAEISGNTLPVVPVEAVKGSTVHYTIGDFENKFKCEDGKFYIDTATGEAYKDEECTERLGDESDVTITSPAILDIWAELDGVESSHNIYRYSASGDDTTLAPPYADKDTGIYEEINYDGNGNFLVVKLYSLNNGDEIQYMLDNSGTWNTYDGTGIKMTADTVLHIRSKKGNIYSGAANYVYQFVPLPPIITLESGRYSKSPMPDTYITLDKERVPKPENYSIFFRRNGDPGDTRLVWNNEEQIFIEHTMSLKAYVKNDKTDKVSESVIHYYIIESDNLTSGSVYIANPYDVERISADVLNKGDYSEGIKLLTQNKNAEIHYFYSYNTADGKNVQTGELVYDNTPIIVNSSMEDITITAWLIEDGERIKDSDFTHTIDFIHLGVPVTSLGSDKVEFDKGTTYTLKEYPNADNIILYYTLDGSDPSDPDNENRIAYSGETLTLNEAVTVKAVYFSACDENVMNGTCGECKNENIAGCSNGVYGKVGEYKYTVPTVKYTGGGGGGGGGRVTVDNTRKYTKDIFGYEHPTHIGYIKGYPDGSVKPDSQITREEVAAILYRVKNREYDEPFATTGEVFPDVTNGRWSLTEIEYMANDGVVYGYPDGEFKPAQNLTRAEFAALIYRFIDLDKPKGENIFPDLEEDHWAYENVLSLYEGDLIDGYEDGTFRPENQITRAEVMTVMNKILGRNPSEPYVRTLNYNPFNDLELDKWYYVIVLEATITHNYYLDDKGVEIKWEDCK